MTSQINPNNINGSYPVAGQDNNSQGFRDNFTNTRTNFAAAAAEITDLQNKAILKAPLTGTLVADNNMNGTRLVNVQLQDTSVTVVDLQNINGPVNINYESGQYQYNATTTGSVTLNLSNFPSAVGGTTPMGTLTIRITVSNVAHTVTISGTPSLTIDPTSLKGIQGMSGNTITFAQTGTYELVFNSTNGGTLVYMHELTRPRNYYTNPLFLDVPELWSANGNVSLSTSTTVFTVSGSMTGNLNAGSAGQIKILAYGNASVGNTLITVSNAAWGGANVANLSAVGSACTMQYVNSKWFVIGNNGVTFS